MTAPRRHSPDAPTVRTRDAITRASARLDAAGVASPRVDAEILAASVLGVARGRLAVDAAFTAEQLRDFDRLVARRTAREPLQHLTGTAGFRHLDLRVGTGVFVPRPETELLAGWGIAAARAAGTAPIVVDLCSGSGAIALSVAQEAPGARVWAVERSPGALRWLRRNATDRAAAGDPLIAVVAADVTAPRLLDELVDAVDVLLCNPPYVPDGTPVPPEVLDHDPTGTVGGGPAGRASVRPVVARATALLRPGAVIGIEHDETQADAVRAVFAHAARFEAVELHRDLAGRPRYTTARKSAHTGPWQTG
ncbi:MAG TPA: peptide chain release factor N(5)-glutamine methyltransferase [Asanoa sp.]